MTPVPVRLRFAVADTLAVTHRNLIGYVRIPQNAFFASVQPVMFVLLFRYVLGGAVRLPGGIRYVDYLMPGIFVQTMMFGAMSTAVGLAGDKDLGLIERFKSLPMARSAVLAGRTTADMVRNLFVVVVLLVVGTGVGFRVHTSAVAFLAAVALLLGFAYALSWGFAYLALHAPNAETAQLMAIPIIMPSSFASSGFVPLVSMPDPLQAFARNQPVTKVIDATRALVLGGPTSTAVLHALLWIGGMLAVLAPLAVRRYRRTI